MTSVHKRVIKDIKDGKQSLKEEFGILIAPEDDNFYKVHFVLPGPEETPYEGGLYHGMIRLNDNHPHKAPNIHMITPNGRFEAEPCPIPDSSRGICTTATAFHPESWTPMNNIATVIIGFISLMCDDFDKGVGAIDCTESEKIKLAKKSHEYIKSDKYVKRLFPEFYQELIDGTYKFTKLSDLAKKKFKKTPKKIESESSPETISSDIDDDIKLNSDSDDSEEEIYLVDEEEYLESESSDSSDSEKKNKKSSKKKSSKKKSEKKSEKKSVKSEKSTKSKNQKKSKNRK